MRGIVQISVLLLCAGVTAALGQNENPRFGYNPRPDFIRFDASYRDKKNAASDRLQKLQGEMVRQQRQGRKTRCLRQVFMEARWLVYDTADWARINAKLDDFEARLRAPKDPHDGSQVEADGSFGCCSSEWFLKLDATTDALVSLKLKLSRPPHPVKLLDRVNTPAKLRAYLDSVLIADVAQTGVDTRHELNSSTSCLTRLLLWSGTLRQLPSRYPVSQDLKDALIDYEDNHWQDPETGYFGTWYRTQDGRIKKPSDLSETFHLVSYRQGKVQRWPQIIKTTLAIKDAEYPYGWLEDGRMSNHHNYDAARLFHLGWPHANPAEQAEIRAGIKRMVDFAIKESLQPDGTFLDPAEDTLGSSFYFGVALLHEVGYFSTTNRFWTQEKFPAAEEVRKRVRSRIEALKLDDSEAEWAAMILDTDY
jgi:hypothetical protein